MALEYLQETRSSRNVSLADHCGMCRYTSLPVDGPCIPNSTAWPLGPGLALETLAIYTAASCAQSEGPFGRGSICNEETCLRASLVCQSA